MFEENFDFQRPFYTNYIHCWSFQYVLLNAFEVDCDEQRVYHTDYSDRVSIQNVSFYGDEVQ